MPTKAASAVQSETNNVQDLFDMGPSQPVASTPNAGGAGDGFGDDWGDFGSFAAPVQ